MDEARRLVDIAIDDPDADYMDLPGAGTRATTSTTTTSASSAASAGAARSAAAARAGGAAGGGGARAGGVQGTEGGLLARLPSWCVCTCLRRLCAETVEIGPRSVVVLRLLGEGGFSFVYLVEDSRTGEQFALKRIHCQEPEQARAVRQEIAVHLAFDHRHLLPLAGHSFERLPSGGERANLLFPYYPSGTIEDFLQRSRPRGPFWDEAQCLRVLRGIALGLLELHTAEPPLAHRDLKPHNILLAADGTPVLMDFGSMGEARQPALTRSDSLRLQEWAQANCSMPYRAPELWDVPRPTGVTEAVDVWSLGCTLYAMAFGYSPFECQHFDDGSVRVVDVTHLRVIGRVTFPPYVPPLAHSASAAAAAPASTSASAAAASARPRTFRYSAEFRDLILSMLRLAPHERPTVQQILNSTDALLAVAERRHAETRPVRATTGSSSTPPSSSTAAPSVALSVGASITQSGASTGRPASSASWAPDFDAAEHEPLAASTGHDEGP